MRLIPLPHPAAIVHCVKDRAAMVYDRGVVTSARANNRQMAVYGIEVLGARLVEVPGLVSRAVASVRGVNPRSLRISMEAVAFSFSFTRRTTAPQVAAALDALLAPLGLRVRPLDSVTPPSRPRASRS
ncbi:MAG TPA: hypothetical protein VM122_06940 [Usitatibacter sp.]|nr:hypothetical protein [Usitatibacter sp.]